MIGPYSDYVSVITRIPGKILCFKGRTLVNHQPNCGVPQGWNLRPKPFLFLFLFNFFVSADDLMVYRFLNTNSNTLMCRIYNWGLPH